MLLNWLAALAGIVLVDLTLSGDNALVIGAAAAGLASEQRRRAIVVGGAGALLLRIVFAIAATLLLNLPLLQAIGGIILLVIAVRLLIEHTQHADDAEEGREVAVTTSGARKTFLGALLTILVADLTMSLDNVLAIGALAHGDLPLLIVGLLISVTLLLVGSALVATLINRLPWLMDVAALVLGWTAASMILHDPRLHPYIQSLPREDILIPALALAIVGIADVALRVRSRRAAHAHVRESA